MINYTELSDKELLRIYDAKTGGIPINAVIEVKRRRLKKFVNRTVTSDDGPKMKK